jgi:ATP-dependent RNA helicase DHX37/DHR1
MIGVTQPRRVAAIASAQRVAIEMDSRIGSVVGYQVPPSTPPPPSTPFLG